MSCPRCSSDAMTKDRTTPLGGQRFRCNDCYRRFTRRSTSAFSGRAFPDDIIALAVRWYVRYRLSYAEVSEWLAERGVVVDQSTIYRWVQRFLPLFAEAACKYRQAVGLNWRVDETYARIRGRWHYIYRAIDDRGQIVDAYVSPTRDTVAAQQFFWRAIASSGTTPHRVITDKAATYPPALASAVPGVLHRTGRYRTNGVERDHGFLKRTAAADARPQVCSFSGDLHPRSRLDAQHPPWVLSSRRGSSATAGPCLDLEPTRPSGVIPQQNRADRLQHSQTHVVVALATHADAREPA
jgi:transposase, IS6 family